MKDKYISEKNGQILEKFPKDREIFPQYIIK